MTMSTTTSTLLAPHEAAKRLRLNPGTLAQWRFHKTYPLRFVRIGSKIFYREEDLQAFIELRTESGTVEEGTPAHRRSQRRISK
jgi:Helix-turn-helix domain